MMHCPGSQFEFLLIFQESLLKLFLGILLLSQLFTCAEFEVNYITIQYDVVFSEGFDQASLTDRRYVPIHLKGIKFHDIRANEPLINI